VRTDALPEPSPDRTVDYAECRPELKGMEPGETVLAIEKTEGFIQQIRPALARIDRDRRRPRSGERKRRGTAPRYHAIDYWRLEMLRRVISKHSTKDTRDWLTTDRAKRTRELLGFDQPRAHYGGKPPKLTAGVATRLARCPTELGGRDGRGPEGARARVAPRIPDASQSSGSGRTAPLHSAREKG
jgi:hypothetical protein